MIYNEFEDHQNDFLARAQLHLNKIQAMKPSEEEQ